MNTIGNMFIFTDICNHNFREKIRSVFEGRPKRGLQPERDPFHEVFPARPFQRTEDGRIVVQARHITCRTAYRLINNFPGAPGPYKPYRCKDHFEGDGFRFVCTDGPKAFRFNAAGD